MGSYIEINDLLKISRERGFPVELRLEDHIRDPQQSNIFLGQEFTFWNKGERLYHRAPTRVFLVEEVKNPNRSRAAGYKTHFSGIKGKWLYWGHVLVTQQTITAGRTEGKYQIIKLYNPDYQRLATIHEAPKGRSYF
ncbi:MAG TPA: hypothetical protein VJI32_06470 [Candidatus Nanoarchaeia archaeon]|nr:hypothetical protein [Candidatus Nanoarchaeia archaeon]